MATYFPTYSGDDRCAQIPQPRPFVVEGGETPLRSTKVPVLQRDTWTCDSRVSRAGRHLVGEEYIVVGGFVGDGDGTAVVAHAGSVAVRMLADRTGLTGQLSRALRRRGSSRSVAEVGCWLMWRR